MTPEEGRLVCPKYRENSSSVILCYLVNNVKFFFDKTARFAYSHLVYENPYNLFKPFRKVIAGYTLVVAMAWSITS